jgi:hypothetical protein
VLRRSSCAGCSAHVKPTTVTGLQGLTEEQLEGLYAGLLRLSALSAEEQSTVLQALLDGRV